MITIRELRTLSQARLQDANVLWKQRRYDGPAYLCGYAIETALKARICRTLKWAGYPETRSEFGAYQSFKIHDLNTLLHLSGIEDRIKTTYLIEWSIVVIWDPEMRYRRIGSTSATDAQDMLNATRKLLKTL